MQLSGMQLTYLKTLKYAFGVVLSILTLGALYNFYSVNKLFERIENLYLHPYTISNTVRDINIQLVSMHRSMKNIALAENINEVNNETVTVAKHESEIIDMIPVLYDRYLGPVDDIKAFEQAFLDWRDIRSEAISLTLDNRLVDAAFITKSDGANQVTLIEQRLRTLMNFANNKGKEFYYGSLEDRHTTLVLTLLGTLLSLIIAIWTAIYVFKLTLAKEEKIKRYFHVIDQNIYSVVFDLDGKIIESSNAFSLFLNTTKHDLLTQNVDYFVKDPDVLNDIFLSVNSGFDWKGEIQFDNDTWLSIKVTPSFNKEYRISRFNMILHDISATKRIEALSYSDPLTELKNRRYFDFILPDELKHAQRTDETVVFAMLDIDHFKNFNDHYGHQEGDKALQNVAKTLSLKMRRPKDLVFRIGGEEFAIFFSLKDPSKTPIFLKEVVKEIEDLHINHLKSETASVLTISLGAIICKPSAKISLAQCYKQADQLLYQAKQTGRNKAVTEILQ